MKFSKFFSVFSLITILSLIFPKQSFADGMILPPNDYYVYESSQKAFIIYDDEMEHLVVSISFLGNAEDFGWVIPVPNEPTVNKVNSDFFDNLSELTTPKKSLYQKLINPEEERYYLENSLDSIATPMAEGAKETSVNVVSEERVGILDVAVLEAESVEDLQEWMDENGYNFPEEEDYYEMGPGPIIMKEQAELEDSDLEPESSELESTEEAVDSYYYNPSQPSASSKQLVQDYLDSNWYFVVAKINNTFTDEFDEEYYWESNKFIDPLRISFESSDMVFPMKLTALQNQGLGVEIYTLTQSKTYVSNYKTSDQCLESEQSEVDYNGYLNENLCSDFPVIYGDVISKAQIESLTKEIARDSWYQTDQSMYITRHHADYISPAKMTVDVLFEDQGNREPLNNGEMTITEYIKLPFAFIIYGPTYLFNSISNFDFYYWNDFSFVLLLVGIGILNLILSFSVYLLLKRTYLRKLRIILYVIQFPFVCISSLSIGLLLGLLNGWLYGLLDVNNSVLMVNSVLFGWFTGILSVVLFYRLMWKSTKTQKKQKTELNAL